jgi:DNA-directed RNA polymerase subunit delta
MAEEARVLNYSPEELEEMALVDIAYDVLRVAGEPMYYKDLIKEVARVRGLTEEEVNQVIARVYTEINVDGRFVCIGNNVWGLKRWYPIDKTMDKTASKQFIRKDIDDDFYDDEDEDLYDDMDHEDEEYDPYIDDDSEELDPEVFDELSDDDVTELEEEPFEELEEAEVEEFDNEDEEY